MVVTLMISEPESIWYGNKLQIGCMNPIKNKISQKAERVNGKFH